MDTYAMLLMGGQLNQNGIEFKIYQMIRETKDKCNLVMLTQLEVTNIRQGVVIFYHLLEVVTYFNQIVM